MPKRRPLSFEERDIQKNMQEIRKTQYTGPYQPDKAQKILRRLEKGIENSNSSEILKAVKETKDEYKSLVNKKEINIYKLLDQWQEHIIDKDDDKIEELFMEIRVDAKFDEDLRHALDRIADKLSVPLAFDSDSDSDSEEVRKNLVNNTGLDLTGWKPQKAYFKSKVGKDIENENFVTIQTYEGDPSFDWTRDMKYYKRKNTNIIQCISKLPDVSLNINYRQPVYEQMKKVDPSLNSVTLKEYLSREEAPPKWEIYDPPQAYLIKT